MKHYIQCHGTKALFDLRVSSALIRDSVNIDPLWFTVAIKSYTKNGSVKWYLLFEYGKVLKLRVIVAPVSTSPNLYNPVVEFVSALKNLAMFV